MQLTDGPGVHSYSPTFDRKEKKFFLLQGNELKSVSSRSGVDRRVYRTPAGWRMTGHLSVSDNARYAAVVEMKEEDWVDDGVEHTISRRRSPLTSASSRRRDRWGSHSGRCFPGCWVDDRPAEDCFHASASDRRLASRETTSILRAHVSR